MAFITVMEIVDILFMTFGVGFIFSDYFRREPLEGYDPLKYYSKSPFWENIKFAAMIAAPAIVLHELAHKFVAMSFGATATLHAPYTMYMVVMLLKVMHFPLIFFVGGYVQHSALPYLPSALVSLAGPFMNLIIWLSIWLIVRLSLVHKRYYKILEPMAKISLFLCLFNLIPIPGFDGYNAVIALFRAFTS